MRIHEFGGSNSIGKQGERIIIDALVSFGGIAGYEDKSDDPSYQKWDIDGILWTHKGAQVTVELKTDTYTSNRIFYETKSCVEHNTMGCMEKTKAKYVYYYFPNYGFMYCINVEEYRKWVHANIKLFAYVTFPNKNPDGTVYHSGGRLIPLPFFEKNFRYWKKFPMPKVNLTPEAIYA